MVDWQDAWRREATPWDAGGASPVLQRLVRDGALAEGRALVPGAGSGYDVLALASATREVVGLDLAPGASARFNALAAQDARSQFTRYVVGDFFAADLDGPFDLIWDYTFCCALPPALRPDWARRTAQLTKPGGQLAHLMFPVASGPPADGPPFSLEPEALQALLAPYFDRSQLTSVKDGHEARSGREVLAVYRRR